MAEKKPFLIFLLVSEQKGPVQTQHKNHHLVRTSVAFGLRQLNGAKWYWTVLLLTWVDRRRVRVEVYWLNLGTERTRPGLKQIMVKDHWTLNEIFSYINKITTCNIDIIAVLMSSLTFLTNTWNSDELYVSSKILAYNVNVVGEIWWSVLRCFRIKLKDFAIFF